MSEVAFSMLDTTHSGSLAFRDFIRFMARDGTISSHFARFAPSFFARVLWQIALPPLGASLRSAIVPSGCGHPKKGAKPDQF
jgi:hypothetical protein